MSYLLDTNTCIAVINGGSASVDGRLRAAQEAGDGVAISAIVAFELWFGVANSRHVEINIRRLAIFLSRVEVKPFDDEDARKAGELRAELRRKGTPIGPYDLLIAAQAARRKLAIVTANTREFRRISGLRVEDWSRPQ